MKKVKAFFSNIFAAEDGSILWLFKVIAASIKEVFVMINERLEMNRNNKE
jgi:hypothetical protein